jgi:hypothetical protein
VTPPEGMDLATYRRIDRLPADQRYRVLERAAILHTHAGLPWGEADRRALAEELDQRRPPRVGT